MIAIGAAYVLNIFELPSQVAFSTDDLRDVIKYVIAVEVPSYAAHSEHDADPGFQEFNRRADLLQPEDPLVYGGEVLHAV